MRWILGDTETTGLGSDSGVVEIGWIEIDDNFTEIARHSSLINPLCPIQHGAMAIHGITDEHVALAPTLPQYMDSLGHPLKGEDVVLVAHNAPFDLKYFSPYLEAPKTLCTLKASRVIYPDADNHKLITLAYYLGLEVSRQAAHSAMGDVVVLLQLIKRMNADSGLGLQELFERVNQPRIITKMPFGKHKGSKLSKLPSGYISWLKGIADLDKDLRTALEAL